MIVKYSYTLFGKSCEAEATFDAGTSDSEIKILLEELGLSSVSIISKRNV